MLVLRFRPSVLTLGLLLLALAPPAPASATTSHLTVNTLKPDLEKAESGSGSKVELEFTNITDGPAILSVTVPGQSGCTPTFSREDLPPNQLTPVEVEIPAGTCDTGSGALKLNVRAELTGEAFQEFTVEPGGSGPGKPQWKALFLFPILLLLGLAVAANFLFRRWKPPGDTKKKAGPTRDKLRCRFCRQLVGVDSTWKFNDNWATNVTAAGALLTGLFGATTAKAFLGEDAESLTALATVGAAISVALVAAAPIVVLATKSYAPYKKKPGDFFTVGGILLGGVVVSAAAIGQLGIIAWSALELEIGIAAKGAIAIAFVIGAVLVTVYACRSLKVLVDRGTAERPKEPAAELEAAAVIAKELQLLRKQIASVAAAGIKDEAARHQYFQATKPGVPTDGKETFEELAPAVSFRPNRSALI